MFNQNEYILHKYVLALAFSFFIFFTTHRLCLTRTLSFQQSFGVEVQLSICVALNNTL
jgi:hypothetical protein